jgi:hypothetical protein
MEISKVIICEGTFKIQNSKKKKSIKKIDLNKTNNNSIFGNRNKRRTFSLLVWLLRHFVTTMVLTLPIDSNYVTTLLM